MNRCVASEVGKRKRIRRRHLEEIESRRSTLIIYRCGLTITRLSGIQTETTVRSNSRPCNLLAKHLHGWNDALLAHLRVLSQQPINDRAEFLPLGQGPAKLCQFGHTKSQIARRFLVKGQIRLARRNLTCFG